MHHEEATVAPAFAVQVRKALDIAFSDTYSSAFCRPVTARAKPGMSCTPEALEAYSFLPNAAAPPVSRHSSSDISWLCVTITDQCDQCPLCVILKVFDYRF